MDLVTQIKIITQIVRCIHLKKVLTAIDPSPKLNFWRLMYGDLLDISVLEWTKVFGSNAEPSHWKGIVSDHKKFKTELLQYVSCTESEWASYWNLMKDYRDEHVAHHSSSPTVTNYPTLNLALRSCYFYYSYLIKEARAAGETRFPNDLEEYSKKFADQSTNIAKAAIFATSEFQELVF